MRTRCLLVDDEPLALQLLQKHVEQIASFDIKATASNGLHALEILRQGEIDLLFCDIKMPKVTGLDLLRTLRHPPKTILTTAYREFALDGYELDVIDYLLKPITFDRFLKAVERYWRLMASSQPVLSVSATEPRSQWLFFKSGSKTHRLQPSDVMYIEGQKDYVRIVTISQIITSKRSLSELEMSLTNGEFLRVHRSFIINRQHVTAYSVTEIDLGPHRVPIGANYRVFVGIRLGV